MRLCLLLVLLWQSLLSRRCLRDDGESASEVSVDVGDDHDVGHLLQCESRFDGDAEDFGVGKASHLNRQRFGRADGRRRRVAASTPGRRNGARVIRRPAEELFFNRRRVVARNDAGMVNATSESPR